MYILLIALLLALFSGCSRELAPFASQVDRPNQVQFIAPVVETGETEVGDDVEPLERNTMKPQVTSSVSTEQLRERYSELSTFSDALADSEEFGPVPQEGNHSRLDTVNNMIIINPAKVLAEKEVIISAGIQGKLTSLRVNAKDRNGMDILDSEGNPVMIEVKEGQVVSKDQEIGTIDDSIELKKIAAAEALLAVAIAEEKKVIEIEYARAAWTVAVAADERNKLMNAKTPNTVPQQQVMEDELKRTQAQKQFERAIYDLNVIRPAETNVKEQELAIAQTLLGQRRLVSSINGIVEELYGYEGMWFREGERILRITQYDTLKIKGKINIKHATPGMVHGKTVEVVAEPLGKERSLTFTGTVTFASQTIQPDGAFDIHVEVKNQLQNGYWLLNPGRFVELRIKL